jgi:ABC-2 type transport system ATP-binding protein
VIRTRGLTRRYGDALALDEVDLDVPEGSVYGLVGPNGSGKTTLLSILAGLRRPTAGEVVLGVEQGAVAVLPDAPRYDRWLTGREVVALAASLTSAGTDDDRLAAVLQECGLADAADRSVGGYSRGMLQRLGVAATVVGRPELVLLDEPASALDPAGRREVLDLVGRLRGRATVVFSSHILDDVQQVCDRLGVLRAGRLVFQGPTEDLLGTYTRPGWRIRLRGGGADVAAALAGQPWVRSAAVDGERTVVVEATDVERAERELAGALAASGARLVGVEPLAPSLEQVFLELTT